MNWLKHIFARRRIYGDLSEEIRAHLDEKIEDLVAAGMPRGEAEHAARRQFGNVLLTEQTAREVWQWPALENFWMDLRYALRMLRKSKGFAAAAILILAIGIGANTAVFSILNAALFSSPYSQPDRIVSVGITSPFTRKFLDTSQPVLLDTIYGSWEKCNRSFSAMTAWRIEPATLTGAGPPELLPVAHVTAGFFRVLGVRPTLGRAFRSGEGGPGQPATAILSYQLWHTLFASSPKVVGRTMHLDDQLYTVVGVMPASFEFPEEGVPEPLVLLPRDYANAPISGQESARVTSLGRLKPGISLEKAQADLEVISQQDANESHGFLRAFLTNNRVLLVPLRERLVGNAEPVLLVLWGAVGFLLLIACVNVANLTLARGLAREREIAVRVALGAHRRRVSRQLLTENLLIASFGAVAGLALAYGAVILARQLGPANLPRLRDASIDLPVLAFTAGLAALAGILAGLAPVRAAWRLPTVEALKEGSRLSASRGHRRLRNALVVTEIAMALMLAIGSGLLVRSFLRITAIDLGMNPHNVLTAEVAKPPGTGSARLNLAAQRHLAGSVLERVRALPQVVSAAIAGHMPMSGIRGTDTFLVKGRPVADLSLVPRALEESVSPDYFRTLGIPIIAGRGFEPRDAAPAANVVIVNEALVRRYFPPGDPIGRQLVEGKMKYRVVGVVGNIRERGLLSEPFPTIFGDYDRLPAPFISLVIRTTGNPLALVPALRAQVQKLDSTLPVFNVATMEERLAGMEAPYRFETVVLGIFALVSLVLAALGVYGVISYSVSQRAHEIGIRMALGAEKGAELRSVVGKALALALFGIGIGTAGAFVLTRFLQSLLYQVRPDDPWAFTLAAAVLLLAALLAGYFPARRAMGIDPVTALRSE